MNDRPLNNSLNEEVEDYIDFEDWEDRQKFFDDEDFAGMVTYYEEQVKRTPQDYNAQYYLGEAYVFNGQYDKAISHVGALLDDDPGEEMYQFLVLDALFAQGKDENAYMWIEKPRVKYMSDEVLNFCFKFLKSKRKGRALIDLHSKLEADGEYLVFSARDLYEALLSDPRFEVEVFREDFSVSEIRAIR